MAGEYPVDLTDLSKITWAEGGTETITEIPSDKRTPGFHTPGENEEGEVDLAAWVNWWRREIGRAIRCLGGSAVRRYQTLAAAIAATSLGELFQVHRSSGSARLVGAAAHDWTITAADLDSIRHWCIDGERLYVVFHSAEDYEYIRSYSLIDGTLIEETSLATYNNVRAVCCDGDRVFAACDALVVMLNAETLAIIDSEAVPSMTTVAEGGVACNGSRLCTIGYDAVNTKTWFFSYTAGALSAITSATHGTFAGTEWLHAVALSDRYAFVTGAEAASGDNAFLRVYYLPTQALIYHINASGSPNIEGKALAVVGDELVLASTASDPDGSYESSLWVYTISTDGTAPLSFARRNAGTFGALDLWHISADRQVVAVTDEGSSDIYLARLADLQVIGHTSTGAQIRATALDGHYLWSVLSRVWTGYQLHPDGSIYVRLAADDTTRPLPGRAAAPRG